MDYTKLMEAVGVQPAVTHNCPECHGPAKCDIMRGESVCWCFNVQSQARTLENYDVCMCKKCLTTYTI